MSTSRFILCGPSGWTTLWTAPSFGLIYLWNGSPDLVRVPWRAYYSGFWFYSEGMANAAPGKNTVGFGTPNPYTQFEVRPPIPVLLMVT